MGRFICHVRDRTQGIESGSACCDQQHSYMSSVARDFEAEFSSIKCTSGLGKTAVSF
jgi:hypothetical protein